jgi:hypothetical protein
MVREIELSFFFAVRTAGGGANSAVGAMVLTFASPLLAFLRGHTNAGIAIVVLSCAL